MTISTEDRLQIEDLAARYNQAIDLSDPDGWVSCFSADGELVIGRVGSFSAGVLGLAEGRWRGPAELHDFATATASRQFRHWSCNRVLASTAAGITSVSYMNVYYLGLPPGDRLLTGIMRDQLVRDSTGWRFARRRIEFDR